MSGPLDGLRVLELGQLIAGPFCGQLLGDMGADVIKVEQPNAPDPMREWGQARPNGKSVWFSILARNKRCITLDLRHSEGAEILKELAAKSDILIENFRPGTMEKWGLGYDVLRGVNRGLIMVRVSGYGQTGPYAPRAGYASVGEAMGGMRYVMGEPDRMPSRAGISIGDSLAAAYACMGALAALEHRRKTGDGQIVDSAIYESCLAMMESLIPDYQHADYIRERSGSVLPKIAPSNIYPASDGMLVIAANQDSVFKRLCEAMGEPDLAKNPAYASHIARGERQHDLDARIAAWSSRFTCADLEAICATHGVPCGRLYRAPEMLADPHYLARDAIIAVDDPDIGPIQMQNVTPKLSATPGAVRWPGPAHGAHTQDVLRDLLGYEASKIAALRTRGVV